MVKPLLVGEAPGPNTRPDCPLFPYPSNSAGARLRELTGLSIPGYVEGTCRVNLLAEYPGERWPTRRAEAAAANLRGGGLLDDRTVILVGHRVWRAFYPGIKAEPCRAFDLPTRRRHRARVGMVPHPSGRNRWYNSEANRAAVRRFFEEVLR